jgi:hypothetical protein
MTSAEKGVEVKYARELAMALLIDSARDGGRKVAAEYTPVLDSALRDLATVVIDHKDDLRARSRIYGGPRTGSKYDWIVELWFGWESVLELPNQPEPSPGVGLSKGVALATRLRNTRYQDIFEEDDDPWPALYLHKGKSGKK